MGPNIVTHECRKCGARWVGSLMSTKKPCACASPLLSIRLCGNCGVPIDPAVYHSCLSLQIPVTLPADPNEITLEDLDNLFDEPSQDFELIDDKDYWWKQRGECPTCKDGSQPKSMPGGSFECLKCGWRN